MCVYIYIYLRVVYSVYIYIYIERERWGERERLICQERKELEILFKGHYPIKQQP